MRLTLTRTAKNEVYSTGILGMQQPPWFTCDSLEPGTAHPYPCIPDGKYDIVIRHSEKWDRPMPFVNVPGRVGIEIHPGNMPPDTHGCILVGVKNKPPLFLQSSKATFDKLFALLEADPMPHSLEVVSVPNPNKPQPA